MDIGILGAINLWAQFLAGLFVVICIALIIIVLLQKGRGGGLSAAFGGAGGQSLNAALLRGIWQCTVYQI